jgi:hypothetical protein
MPVELAYIVILANLGIFLLQIGLFVYIFGCKIRALKYTWGKSPFKNEYGADNDWCPNGLMWFLKGFRCGLK